MSNFKKKLAFLVCLTLGINMLIFNVNSAGTGLLASMTEDTASNFAYVDFSTGEYAKMKSCFIEDNTGNAITSAVVSYQGRNCTLFDRFLWADIDDGYLTASTRNIKVRVTYYDLPASNQYSHINSQYKSTGGGIIANEQGRIAKFADSGAWKTAELDLTPLSVTFDNSMNAGNSDFNLWCDNMPSGVYVSRVEVIDTGFKEDTDSDIAYIDFETRKTSKLTSWSFSDNAESAVVSGIVSYQGRECLLFDRMMWLNISDTYVRAADRSVTVKVTYFDLSPYNDYSHINSQYMSAGGSVIANEHGRIAKFTGTDVWKTAEFNLTGLSVTFNNSMNGNLADFGLWCDNMPLTGVYVSRVEVVNQSFHEDTDSQTAYVDFSKRTYSKMQFAATDKADNGIQTGLTELDGVKCMLFDNLLWLDVSDSYITFADRNIRVRVEYFDSDPINEYSHLNMQMWWADETQEHRYIANEKGRITPMRGTGVWKAAELNLTALNIMFDNSVNGGTADVGLWCDNMLSAGIYVKYIEIVNAGKPHVDKTELIKAISKPIIPQKYTESSYQDYLTALEASLLVFENPAAMQGDVNTALGNLTATIDSLIVKAGHESKVSVEFGETIQENGMTFVRADDPAHNDMYNYEYDFNGDIIRKSDKYIYFKVSNNPADFDAMDIRQSPNLIFELEFYDIGMDGLVFDYNADPSKLVSGTNNANYERYSIRKDNSGKLVWMRFGITNAQFRSGQNNGADFRIAEMSMANGVYLKSVTISVGAIDMEGIPAPAFPASSAQNELIGKTVTGYQVWHQASSDLDSGWAHWSVNSAPEAGNVMVEMYPDVRDYPLETLYPTNLENLLNNRPALVFNTKDEAVIDLHLSWMKEYGIDGCAIQRFFGSANPSETNRETHINTIQKAAEKHDRIFYVMYDFTGFSGTQDGIAPRIKGDWIYNMEQKGVISSPNYAQVGGKPVVCLWGLTDDNPERYPNAAAAMEMIKWFQDRGYFVIGGFPNNRWTTVTDEYAEVYRSIDMASPWTVGRYADENSAVKWLNENITRDTAHCEQYGILYQPVIFPGFAWSNLNNGPPNVVPRNAGQFFWAQAKLLADKGFNMAYLAMFDEYDEGTAFIKAAEDSLSIPTGQQYFQTLAVDGTWLSSDFYLRAAGAAIDMLKGNAPVRDKIDIPHAIGPVYWRNGFEMRWTQYQYNGTGTKYTVSVPLDVGVRKPAILLGSAQIDYMDLYEDMDYSGLVSTGEYSFKFGGTAFSADDGDAYGGKLYMKIADTKIPVLKGMQLSYSIMPETDLGRYSFVDLLFDDGSKLSDYTNTMKALSAEVDYWAKMTCLLDDSLIGKIIVGVITAYDHDVSPDENGSFVAYFDDLLIDVADPDVEYLRGLLENSVRTSGEFSANSDMQVYTQSSRDALNRAIDNAKLILSLPDSSAQELKRAYQDLQSALNGLEIIKLLSGNGNNQDAESPDTGESKTVLPLIIVQNIAAFAAVVLAFRHKRKKRGVSMGR